MNQTPDAAIVPTEKEAAPAGTDHVDLAEAHALVDAFNRATLMHRGRLAAPVSALPDSMEAIAAAILASRAKAGVLRLRGLEEALFDLAAFTDDDDAELIRRTAPARPSRRPRSGPYQQAEDRIARQRRQLMNSWHGVSRYDQWSFGSLVPIGQGRRELDGIRDASYGQATGILGTFVLIGLTIVAGALGRPWAIVLGVGFVVTTLILILAPAVATRIERTWRRIDPSELAEARRARVHESFVFGSLIVPPLILSLLFFR